MRRFLIVVGLWLGVSSQISASPAINPGAMFSFLDAGKSALLKRIYNSGSSTAFIKVTVQEILIDEQGNQRELPPETLGNAPMLQHNTLIASPARIIVPANGRQSTRLLFLGARPKERYFRVRFMPVLPNGADTFNTSEAQRKAYSQELAAGVTVLAGFGTVLFVRPDDLKFDTQLHDEANEYFVENAGNSTVLLDRFKDCDLKDPTQCKPLAQHYVLPGRRHRFAKLPGRAYSFVLQEGAQTQEVTAQPLATLTSPQPKRK